MAIHYTTVNLEEENIDVKINYYIDSEGECNIESVITDATKTDITKRLCNVVLDRLESEIQEQLENEFKGDYWNGESTIRHIQW